MSHNDGNSMQQTPKQQHTSQINMNSNRFRKRSRVQIPETVGQRFLQSGKISCWLVYAQVVYAVNIKVKDNNYNYVLNYL